MVVGTWRLVIFFVISFLRFCSVHMYTTYIHMYMYVNIFKCFLLISLRFVHIEYTCIHTCKVRAALNRTNLKSTWGERGVVVARRRVPLLPLRCWFQAQTFHTRKTRPEKIYTGVAVVATHKTHITYVWRHDCVLRLYGDRVHLHPILRPRPFYATI